MGYFTFFSYRSDTEIKHISFVVDNNKKLSKILNKYASQFSQLFSTAHSKICSVKPQIMDIVDMAIHPLDC
jgi:phage-related protein